MPTLSPRQKEYANLLKQGLGDKAIARKMGITPGSVQQCAHRLRMKMQVHTRTQLLVLLLRDGLITLLVLITIITPVDSEAIRGQSRTRSTRITRRINGRRPGEWLDDITGAGDLYQSYDMRSTS